MPFFFVPFLVVLSLVLPLDRGSMARAGGRRDDARGASGLVLWCCTVAVCRTTTVNEKLPKVINVLAGGGGREALTAYYTFARDYHHHKAPRGGRECGKG